MAATFTLAFLLSGVAIAAELAPGGTFSDDDGNIHEAAIEAVAAAGNHQRLQPACQLPVLSVGLDHPRPDGRLPRQGTRPTGVLG